MAPFILGLHLLTAHVDDSSHTFTPGAYIQLEDGITAGFVRNSEGHPSEYAGYTFGRDYAITVGVVHGYKIRPVQPLIVPSMKVGDHVRLMLVPNCHGVPAGVSLGLEF